MQSIQLFIEGQRVDMFQDESVSITQSIQNVKDIAKVFTEFTKTFTLPASKANNKIFKHYYNFDITGGFDARTKKDATLELNYLPFKKGKVKLEGVDLKNRRPKSYRITFFGNTVTLKDLLGEDKLNALSDLNTYTDTYSDTDVERLFERDPSVFETGTVDSISSNQITDSSGFGSVNVGDLITNTTTNTSTFITSVPASTTLVLDEQIFSATQAYEICNHVLAPLITHTKRLTYQTNTHGQTTGNLWYEAGSGTSHHHGIAFNELKYAIRVSKIVDAIETKYGITFSSDFFTRTNTPYNNLYMWLHRKKGEVGFGGQITSFETQITGFTDEVKSNTSMSNNALSIDVPSSFIDDLDVTLYRTGTTEYGVIVKKDGEAIHTETGITDTTKNIDLPNESGVYTIFITHAAQIDFDTSPYVRWTIDVTTPSGSSTETYDLSSSFTAPAEIQFAITEQIPEMKVIDFLTGLFKMFNLTTFVEDDGTIYVDTLDNFYANKKSISTAYDISEFVDVNSGQVDVALPYREVSFSYEDTNTFLAETHNQLFNQEWGKTDFTETDDNNNIVDGGLYSVVAPFSHLKYERLLDLDDNSQTDIQWGYFVDDNQESYMGKPLLFYPVYTNPSQTISFVDEVGSDGAYDSHKAITGSVNMPSNSVSFSSGTSTANINFKNEFNEYTGDNTFTGTLFENYYKTYIQNVFNTKNRITKVKAYLPLRILLNFTLADRFDINGKRYKINSIDTNLKTGESNIELLNEL